ncbi:N-acetylmuramoyl-L-alanine amidase [Tissierella carlieri]|uniref:N-acetylmuramoyl-L-alanine amidase n=1 Tax=Tissierella carlieri TaxID=689904 RepID=UPI003869BFFC
MAKVFLDAGHGGKDPGALGNGLQEKDIALSVTLKVGNILANHGVTVGYSRTTDIFLELADRATRANNFGANVFVSVHCNAFSDTSAKGVETYSYPGSTTGANLSKSIQNSIIASGVYTVNRGTKTADFAVLRLTNMPAALAELAFITNAQDADILRNRQNDLAVAVSKGILNYLGIPYQGGGSTLYKVQVGAFSVKANADNLANELKAKGYSPIVVTVGGLYKVQVGAFSVRANADALANELRAKGYDAIVVAA